MASEQEELKLTAPAEAHGSRIDKYLAEALAAQGLSRSKLQALIEAGSVSVNGAVVRAKHLLREGDLIELSATSMKAEVAGPTLTPVAMSLDILYEDEHLLVVNKAAGISVHPGAGTHEPTLVEGLLHHCGGRLAKPAGAEDDDDADDDASSVRPGIVHRLDKDTTGALVVAKSDRAHAALSKQFHDKTNEREYTALLDGRMPEHTIVVESYLFRDPERRTKFAAVTMADYAILEKSGALGGRRYRYAKTTFTRIADLHDRLTLARVQLHTGRTHQIRVHAAALRLPVVGDGLYGRALALPTGFPPALALRLRQVGRQLLHARTLGFVHPATGKPVSFEAPYPADFKQILTELGVPAT